MIVFAADLHLTPTVWASLPSMRGDAYFGLKQIVDFCIEKEAEALLLGGDVFNTKNPDSLSVKVFQREMNRLIPGCRVIANQGQHDKSTPPWATLCDRVEHHTDKLVNITIDGTQYELYVLDNSSSDWVKNRLEEIDLLAGCDIVMMHQALRQVISYENAWNLDVDWLPKAVKLVLLGDLHMEVSVGKCHYSGSTHIRAMDENPDKSFISVSRDGDELIVKRHPLETRMTCASTILNEADLDAVIQSLDTLPDTNELPEMRPVVLARVAPDVLEAYTKLSKACSDHSVHLRIRDLVLNADKTKNGAVVSGNASIERCLDMAVDREKNPELHSFLLRLLQSMRGADPSAELATVKKELGIDE